MAQKYTYDDNDATTKAEETNQIEDAYFGSSLSSSLRQSDRDDPVNGDHVSGVPSHWRMRDAEKINRNLVKVALEDSQEESSRSLMGGETCKGQKAKGEEGQKKEYEGMSFLRMNV